MTKVFCDSIEKESPRILNFQAFVGVAGLSVLLDGPVFEFVAKSTSKYTCISLLSFQTGPTKQASVPSLKRKPENFKFSGFCRGGRIRTCDLLVPNEAR